MKYILAFLWGVFYTQTLLLAQVAESFDDGNYTANPIWSPNLASDWAIDNGQLRSNAATTNYNFYITTPNTLATMAQWEMKINLQFNTSSTNYVDVYLISQEANLQSTSNSGYFVRIGRTQDDVTLYKFTGTTNTLLIDGLDGRTNASNNILKIKIIRDANNVWSLQTDATGTGNSYQTEGTATDNSFSISAFFGFRIQQSTASFFNRHFFDDIQITAYVPDTTPPNFTDLEVLSANSILVFFSEAVLPTTAQNINNYTLNNGMGLPASAAMNDSKSVVLTFSQNFVNNTNYTLNSQNIEDGAGNKMLPQQISFTFIASVAPQYHELIITEIMADPQGSNQPLNPLPNVEYIELYNRSNQHLNLKNCKIDDESTSRILTTQNYILPPNTYMLLCEAGQASNFQGFGRVLGINSFISLTNSGERLTLKNAQDEILFTIRYSDSWHESSTKADGGWSLEMKDVNNPCLEKGNWSSSKASRGGTPTQSNSLIEDIDDLTAPIVLRAEAIDAQTLRLTFNEKMDKTSLQNATYQINNGIAIQSIAIENFTFSKVTLTLNQPLQIDTRYEISVGQAKDCNLNIMLSTKINFALPAPDASGDVVLNEVLFNPKTGGVDYVELYNASEKFINLKDWKLANVQDGIIANQKSIATDVLVLAPKSYFLLTTNPDITQAQYPKSETRNFIEMPDMPSYNDDEGTVILINANNAERERFFYKDDFHYPLLDTEEGVSLERISPSLPTNNRNSWHSAAERVGFGTPGYINSQSQSLGTQEGEISVSPPIFTPDGDGIDDFTNIQYKFNQSGKVLTAIVFDKQGRKIKTLAENQLLGTEEGSIIWDGTTQTLGVAPQGYYLIVVKVFDNKGNERLYKKPVALGMKF